MTRKKASRPAPRSRGRAAAAPRAEAVHGDAQAVALVLDAAARTRGTARLGDGVFIAPLHRRVGRQLGMSLDEFKRWLLAQNQAQRINLQRLDLVDIVPERIWGPSEINDRGAQFHVVVDPSYRAARGH